MAAATERARGDPDSCRKPPTAAASLGEVSGGVVSSRSSSVRAASIMSLVKASPEAEL